MISYDHYNKKNLNSPSRLWSTKDCSTRCQDSSWRWSVALVMFSQLAVWSVGLPICEGMSDSLESMIVLECNGKTNCIRLSQGCMIRGTRRPCIRFPLRQIQTAF